MAAAGMRRPDVVGVAVVVGGVAVMTTLFCILALELPQILNPGFEILPAMIALAWIIVVPLCYKGNTS